MKTKSLFLTLVLFLLLPLSVKAAEATDGFSLALYGGANGNLSVSGLPSTSGAVYGGTITFAKKPSPHATMDASSGQMIYVTSSPGTAKTVSITWRGSGNTVGDSQIKVYGKHSAFTGGETPSALGSVPGVTLIGSDAYASAGTVNIAVSSGYEFIAISTGDTKIDFTYIGVTWTVPDVTNYDLNFTQTGSGYVWAENSSGEEIDEAAEGDEVTVYFYGDDDGNDLHNFSIYGASAIFVSDWGEDDYTGDYAYTFTMPAHNVDIDATFAAQPSPSRVANPILVNGEPNTYVAEIYSGDEMNFTISTTYRTGSSPSYNRALKSVTSSNTNIVQYVSNTYDPAAGTGTLTLRGLATGNATITITTYQTNGCTRSTRNINVTVVARNTALITELNGRYYAIPNSFSAGAIVTAQELLKSGDNYYYKSGVNPSDITWKAENTAEGFYLKNSAGKYLKVSGTTMSLADGAYEWYKNAYGRFVTGYTTGMCYDEGSSGFTINGQNDYASSSTISECVIEVSPTRLLPASKYTRSLTNGNYATMCLPFPVTRSDDFFSGVEVYNLTGKFMDGETLTGIEITEETGTLVAGKPYIILATASEMNAWYGEETAVSPVSATGLVGNLSSTPINVPVGCYGLASNQLRRVAYAGTATTKQYRAYIDLTDVPEVGGASAPGRRVLYAENVGTSLEDFLENATEINWNEPVYNMLGQRVGKGTTGVLIQHGQKFLVK